MEEKEIDVRKVVDLDNTTYVVAVRLFEKHLPIYECGIYVYDIDRQKWHNFYTEYYGICAEAIDRQNYIINNFGKFIEKR